MYLDYHPDDLEVRITELLVATADQADGQLEACVQEVLQLLLQRLSMDVVFVSEFTEGQRRFVQVEQREGSEAAIEPGAADPLESTWCQRVVDGRLPELIGNTAGVLASGAAPAAPFPIGTHLSTPVRLSDGEVYGTLCCFSHGVNAGAGEADLQRLRYTARLLAARLEKSRVEKNAAAEAPAPPPAQPGGTQRRF